MRCYQCRSDVNSDCEKGVHEKYFDECPSYNHSDLHYCRKTIQKRKILHDFIARSNKSKLITVYFLQEKRTIVIRECATVFDSEKCYQMLSPDAMVYSCDCGIEGCNVATTLKGSATNCFFVIVALLIVRLFPP